MGFRGGIVAASESLHSGFALRHHQLHQIALHVLLSDDIPDSNRRDDIPEVIDMPVMSACSVDMPLKAGFQAVHSAADVVVPSGSKFSVSRASLLGTGR